MLLLVVFSLSLLILSQAKTLLIQTADSADNAEDVADVSPDDTAEEGGEVATFGDYNDNVLNDPLRDLLKFGFKQFSELMESSKTTPGPPKGPSQVTQQRPPQGSIQHPTRRPGKGSCKPSAWLRCKTKGSAVKPSKGKVVPPAWQRPGNRDTTNKPLPVAWLRPGRQTPPKGKYKKCRNGKECQGKKCCKKYGKKALQRKNTMLKQI